MVGIGSGILTGKLTGGWSGSEKAAGPRRMPTRVTNHPPSGWKSTPTPEMRQEVIPTPTSLPSLTEHPMSEAPANPPQSRSSAADDTKPSQVTTATLMGLPADQPRVPATRLVIPKLGVDSPVVLIALRDGTWQVDHLTQEVGHLQGTASPGDASNIALAGHVTLARGGDGPFRYLSQLRQGDEVLVFAGEQLYRYVVQEVRVVSPEDVQVTFPTAEPTLTLITCANWNRERRVYDDRVIAIAKLAQ